MGPSCWQASFVTHYSPVAYAAGDSGASQKASGSEAVTEAGSKVATAVTDAGKHFLRVSTISTHFVQVLPNPLKEDFFTWWPGCMLPFCFEAAVPHLKLCVIAHAAGDSIAKSQKAPAGEATKDTASEGAAAAKNAASKGATAAKDATSEGANLASKAGRFFFLVVPMLYPTCKQACKSASCKLVAGSPAWSTLWLIGITHVQVTRLPKARRLLVVKLGKRLLQKVQEKLVSHF